MKKKKAIKLFLLGLVLMLTGCGKEAEPQEQKSITEYYQGNQISLPEDVNYACDIMKSGEESHSIITASTQGLVWETTDGGETWEKIFDNPEETENAYLNEAVFLEDGAVFGSYYEEDKTVYYLISKDGNSKQIELEDIGDATDGFSGIEYYDSLVYGKSAEGQVISFDPYTGNRQQIYESTSYINTFCFMGNDIVLVAADGAQTVAIEEKTRTEDNNFIEDQLYSFVNSNTAFTPNMVYVDENLYVLTMEGLYELNLATQERKVLANGREQSFGNASAWIHDFSMMEDKEVFISLTNSDGECEFWNYSYIPEGVERKVLANEITLYSLEYNSILDSEIDGMNAKRSDFYIDYQFGTNGADSVTKADAMNQLNTELLAGNGPDVILLDGLPQESYMEKGILMDVSELLTKEHLKNIAGSYQVENKVYAIPRYFKLMGIMGDKDIVTEADDLSKMTEAISKEYQKDSDKWIFDLYFGRSYMDVIYHAYNSEFVNGDTLDENKLREFYENVKVIGDISLEQCAETYEEGEVRVDYSYLNIESMDWTMQAVAADDQQLSVGGITNANDYAKLMTYGTNDEKVKWTFLNSNEDVLFVPSQVYAVNVNTDNPESAKEVISYLISDAGYAESINSEEGFPLSLPAIEKQFGFIQEYADEYTTREGNVVTLEKPTLKKAQKKGFVELVQELEHSAETDITLKSIIMEQAENYVNNEGSLEECVREACEKANIYLKE